MKAILGGRIVTPSAIVDGMAVLFEDRILDLVPESAVPEQAEKIQANGNYVLPGLVDMHIHGYLGADASDGTAEGLKTMAEGVAKNGVTSFLPFSFTNVTQARHGVPFSVMAQRPHVRPRQL